VSRDPHAGDFVPPMTSEYVYMKMGADEERARIRRELLAAVEKSAWSTAAGAIVVDLADVLAAIDRVCPEVPNG